MIRENKNLIYTIILLLIMQAGLFLYLSSNKNNDVETRHGASVVDIVMDDKIENLPKHFSYFSSLSFFEESFSRAENDFYQTNKNVYGGIIPHHLIVKDKLASFFLGLEKNKYERVILIGPNHFESGDSNIISSRAVWQTPYGELLPDLEVLEKLNIEVDEEPFVTEHSISGLVSFIKKTQSQAKFIPIILKVATSEEESRQLAEIISDNVDVDKTLVLASVDFSHYLPVDIADFHDTASQEVIENFDFSRIYNMEIDSPASIYTVLNYLQLIGAQGTNLLAHTNSGRMMNDFDDPTTSHSFYYFSKGKSKQKKNISMMFFGDLMIDRHVKEKIDERGLDYLFEKLKGDEDRFFRGLDLVGANLEGAVTDEGEHYLPTMAYDFAFHPSRIKALQKYNFNFFNLANNHFSDQGEHGIIETRKHLDDLGFFYVGCQDKQVDDCSTKVIDLAGIKIGMVGFSIVYGLFDVDLATSSIAKLVSTSDLVIVNIHWGVEYEHQFNQTQENIAHALIDAGADIIIGHHPHVVQGIEVYKNRPIIYSLGNFIFDQYFSQDTQEELGVGINYNKQELNLYLFPMQSENIQTRLMLTKNKQRFLDDLIQWSDLDQEFEEQIKEGRLLIKL
jgi:poly-gamma-glutamate synthesis protein (capsule biosynthesis protein)